jgi:hypothetical protein
MEQTTEARLGFNDLALVCTLAYSSVEIYFELAKFEMCRQPVHVWLLVSFGGILLFRLLHVLIGTCYGDATCRFWLDLRHKGTPRVLMCVAWVVMLPMLTLWTSTGVLWLWEVQKETPQCLPKHFLWFSAMWLGVCIVWVGAHLLLGLIALRRELHIRFAERTLRELEDEDTLTRWGPASSLHTMLFDSSMSVSLSQRGLTLEKLAALPKALSYSVFSAEPQKDECSICLAEFSPTDVVRRLDGCRHTFHKSCIDLWLLQCASCPLCKCEVSVRH